MKKIVIVFVVLFFCCCGVKQENMPVNYNAPTLKETISFLASDDLNGRMTGTAGAEKAALYIEKRFKSSGIKPYYQTYRDNFKANEDDGFNVIGMLPGTDPKLKSQIVILGAHYDHIGIKSAGVAGDSIANGANDNASGTATVLALADHFAQAKNNKRTLVFVLYSAEEMGLLGSKHLADKMQNDGVDLYANLNIEMVGVPMVDKPYLMYLTGYNMSNFAEKINAYSETTSVGFLEKAQDFQLFKRSDNYPFYLAFNVPSQTVSTFDFENFEHYHGVGDETNLMDYTHMDAVVNALIPVVQKMVTTPAKEITLN